MLIIQANNFPTYTINTGAYFEPLFLNPGPVNPNGSGSQRTRFPIGWNGVGRYTAGTLRIWYKGTSLRPNIDFTEEANGLFYNFAVAPSSSDTHQDYLVSYVPRPADLAFAKGTSASAYPGEEYFLFPNWLGTHSYLGDGFWYGKYIAARNTATGTTEGAGLVPVSKKGVIPWTNTASYTSRDGALALCPTKGTGFHLSWNAEWMNIALWCRHHNLYPAGNSASGADGMGCSGSPDPTQSGRTLTGSGPTTWNHNLRAGGITDMVGNVWEVQQGLELRSGVIWIADRTTGVYGSSGVAFGTAYNNTSIGNSILNSAAVINEGIPAFATGTFLTVNGNDTCYSATGTAAAWRGGTYDVATGAGLFAFLVNATSTAVYSNESFRLARTLQ